MCISITDKCIILQMMMKNRDKKIGEMVGARGNPQRFCNGTDGGGLVSNMVWSSKL